MADSLIGRLMAFAIVLLAVVALVIRTEITMLVFEGDVGLALWDMARSFDLLTVALVALLLFSFLVVEPARPSQLAGITLAICVVGVGYHVFLAPMAAQSGTPFIVDHIIHTAVPALTFLWWLIFAPKQPIGPLAPLTWLIWPILYTAYAIGRAIYLGGDYPYAFLNIETLSPEEVGLQLGPILGAFLVGGYVLWGYAKWRSR